MHLFQKLILTGTEKNDPLIFYYYHLDSVTEYLREGH